LAGRLQSHHHRTVEYNRERSCYDLPILSSQLIATFPEAVFQGASVIIIVFVFVFFDVVVVQWLLTGIVYLIGEVIDRSPGR